MARILLGVTGSIAAYRSPDMTKALVASGYDVQVVLTHSAAQFTTPKTLETFSGKKVLSNDPWDVDHLGTDHIRHARWAEAFVVYGATANFIAKLAAGLCDDFLSMQILATRAPVLVVPAMNVEMWENPATQENVRKLQLRGYVFVGPIEGVLACGEKGLGHVASIENILQSLEFELSQEAAHAPDQANRFSYFTSKKVLISLGSMKTDIDDVRFIQNKSSGLMGLEMAKALQGAGVDVHLLAGLLSPSVEAELDVFSSVIRFQSYSEYRESLARLWPSCDVFFSLAAVLDFVLLPRSGKIERGTDELTLKLQATEDLVATCVAQKKPTQKVVAFSLESGATWQECLERAHKKLLKKGADLIVVNRSGLSEQGPDALKNAACLLSPNSKLREFPLSTKRVLSVRLLEAVSSYLETPSDQLNTKKNEDLSLNP